MLYISWLLGGGGVGATFPNLAVQFCACAILAFNLSAVIDFWRSAPLGFRVLAAATITLPLLQIVPLPPALRLALPGREGLAEGLALVGATADWSGLSIEPQRTLLAALGLLAPFTALVLAWKLRRHEPTRGLSLLVGLGMVAIFLGAIQLASANTVLMIQAAGKGTSDLQATFANRNSSGLFFDIALACLVALPATDRNLLDRAPVRVGIGLLLMAGVIVSHSRSAILLSAIPLAVAGIRLWNGDRDRKRTRWARTVIAAAGLGGIAILMVLASGNNRLADAANRFAQTDDARAYIWPDALVTVERFWPAGGGMGTFADAFELDESLETLQPLHAGRAHNEYIEIAYEAGLAGVLLVACWIVWLVVVAVRNRRSFWSPGRLAATMAVAMIALQSLTDYPLRNQSLLCIAAWLIGLFAFDGRQFGNRSYIKSDGNGLDRGDGVGT